MSYRFEISSLLKTPPEKVWKQVASMPGVNAELRPLARMTYPAARAQLGAPGVPIGQRLFRSWILLFGLLPLDYDDLVLARIEPDRGFLETSTLLSQRRWVHERTLQPVGDGCRLIDRIEFEPRLRFLGPLYLLVFRRFFVHRHRRLQILFG